MSTANDLLESIKRARLHVAATEEDVRDAEAILRDRKKKLVEARRKYELAIEEAMSEHRQPSLFDAAPEPVADMASSVYRGGPYTAQLQPEPVADVPAATGTVISDQSDAGPNDPPAVPSWRAMTLTETGWSDNLTPDAWAAIEGVPTAGELADKLLAGELFDLPLFDLESVYALVEMLSEDDEAPIDFDKHFNPTGGEVSEVLRPEPELDSPAREQQRVTLLSEIDDFPDAVFDLLFHKGITSLPTLLEQVAEYDSRLGASEELPLRNRLVAFLVAEAGCKMRPSEHAADAVAKHVGQSGRAAAEVVEAEEPVKELAGYRVGTIEAALHYALHRFQGARARWPERVAKGLSDADLKEAIGYEFGTDGGGSGVDMKGYRIKGGKAPSFHWNTDEGPKTIALSGGTLVNKVREVMGVPKPKVAEVEPAAKKAKRKGAGK